MRLHEILNERLSTSAIGDEAFKEMSVQLPKLLNSWYKYNVQELPFYAYKDNPDARVENIKGVALLTNRLGRWVDEILTIVAKRHVGKKDLGPDLGKRDAYVAFDKLDDTTNGAYYPNWHGIKIDTKFIKPFAEKAYQRMYDSFADNNYEVYPPFEERYAEYDFAEYMRALCRVFVHELTHAQQNERTPGTKHDYHSYVVKNNQEFYKAIKKELGNWDDEAYLGSPQEVDAFAQDFVYHHLRYNIGEEPENQVLYIDDIMKGLDFEIPFSRYGKMTSDRPGVQKAKRRFIKKVYQELDARKAKVQEQIDQRKNRPTIPQDAEYIE